MVKAANSVLVERIGLCGALVGRERTVQGIARLGARANPQQAGNEALVERSAANHKPVVEQLGEQLATVQRRGGLGCLGVVLGGKSLELFDVDPELWTGTQGDEASLAGEPAWAEGLPQPVEQIGERGAHPLWRCVGPEAVGQGRAREGPARV